MLLLERLSWQRDAAKLTELRVQSAERKLGTDGEHSAGKYWAAPEWQVCEDRIEFG